MAVTGAFNANRRHELQLLATLGSYIANFSGFGAEEVVEPEDLIPDAFGTVGVPDREWLGKMYERHERRLEGDAMTEEEAYYSAEEDEHLKEKTEDLAQETPSQENGKGVPSPDTPD